MKITKKFIAVNICIVLILLSAAIYIISVGNHYTLHTNFYSYRSPNVKVDFSSSGVLELEGYRMENGELVIDLNAVGQGKTNMSIFWNFGEGTETIENLGHKFSVNSLGMIFEVTSGNFNFNGYNVAVIAILALLTITEIIMLLKFHNFRKNGNFCYPMIVCGGIGIYVMIILMYIIYKMLNNVMNSFANFLYFVTETGTMLLIALLPIMLLISILLAISNIWLIFHEGYRLVNMLGIVFAFLWAAGVILSLELYEITRLLNIDKYIDVSFVKDILTYIVGYIECVFLSTIVCSYLSTRYKPHYNKDYIIILGCAIRKDGSPTPILRGRIDRALQFEREQYEKSGKHAKFVPSGGQGGDEVVSEAESMKRYLIEQGIPENQILKEDKSVNTYQNMEFSKKVIENDTDNIENAKIAFSTTNYHVFRGYILAKKIGMKVRGLSAKTKLYFFPNAFLREFIGLLWDQRKKHLIFLTVSIIFLSVLYIIVQY